MKTEREKDRKKDRKKEMNYNEEIHTVKDHVF